MKKLLIAAMLLTCTSQAQAGDPWTATDKALLAGATITLAVDWLQTKHIAEEPEDHYERNFILGKHPSEGEVNTYFAVSALSTAALAHVLPSDWRKGFLGSIIAIELVAIGNNYNAGIKFAW